MKTSVATRPRRCALLSAVVILLGWPVSGFAADATGATSHGNDDSTAPARREMMETIARYSRAGPQPIGQRVQDSMLRVPRHEFVPEDVRASAYRDSPLPIGYGQTISQPYIVALMTELAAVEADDTVLEVGTGSGYQAAVLAGLAAHVYTIEIVEPLGRRAEQTLRRLGYSNVEVRIGDGYQGWQEHAPFDAVIVTAAPERIPEPLIAQLRPGGRLVVPVGRAGANQQLTVLEKQSDGSTKIRQVLPVAFVPLTGSRQEEVR